MTNPPWPLCQEGECELRITAKAADRGGRPGPDRPGGGAPAGQFRPLIYGADCPSLEAAVFQLLKEKGLTLGCAEAAPAG